MLLIYHILDDKIEINSPRRFLYGFKIESKVERYIPISESIMRLLYQRGLSTKDIKEQVLIFTFYKKKIRNLDAYINELYLFVFSENFAKFLSLNFPNLRRLNGKDLANTIYKLHTLDDDLLVKRKRLYRTSEVFSTDLVKAPPVNSIYQKLVKNAFAEKKYKVFIGAGINDLTNVDFTNLLTTDWEGVLWITFQFGDFTQFLKAKELSAKGYEKAEWKELVEAVNSKLNPVGMEVLLVGLEEKLNIDTALTLMGYLGFTPKEKVEGRTKFLEETPLKWFDLDYEFIDDYKFVRNLIPVSLEKYYYPKEPMFSGINIYGTFMAYSQFEECSNPHTIIIAKPGSGKSVFLGLLVKEALELNVDELIRKDYRPKIDENIYIRYFDKGYTAELLFKLMEYKGYEVFRFQVSPEEVRINPVEIYDSEDIEFAGYYISLILKSLNLPPLEGGERIIFARVLRQIWENDDLKYVLTLTVGQLKNYSRKIYERLKRDGFDDSVKISEVIKTNPEKYKYLNQPIVSDIFRYLQNISESSAVFENKEDLLSLRRKLEQVKDIKQFSFISELDIKEAKYIYIDLDNLSSSPYFVPIVLGILKKLFYYDKYKKGLDKKALYFFDEAHTLLRYEEFALALEEAVREARKFKISLNFATQNWSDIPPQVIANICTRFFLTPKDNIEQAKEELLNQYKQHLNLSDESIKDLKEIYMKLGKHFIAVSSDNGIFSIKIPINNTLLGLLQTDPPYFVLKKDKVALIRDKMITESQKMQLEAEGYTLF